MDEFKFSENLYKGVDFLKKKNFKNIEIPSFFPDEGFGEDTVEMMASNVLGKATYLDGPFSFAHMDPPTPWITWMVQMWNARLNQNLLHKELSPFATEAEELVIEWIKEFFKMDGGHMCSGSTIANLTALWVARDLTGADTVVASKASHISIEKAAKILNMKLIKIETKPDGTIDENALVNLENAILVLNAGTTCTGTIDNLDLIGKAKWTHVDGAYAGALKFSSKYSFLLKGIEKANSISLSSHKWLYQPKDSAIVLFKDIKSANEIMSFFGNYLSSVNVGIQGSKGANGVTLLATLLYFGKKGIEKLIDNSMENAKHFYEKLLEIENIEVFKKPQTGITLFRPKNQSVNEFLSKLPKGVFSKCKTDKEYVRSVAINPLAKVDEIIELIKNL
jgi:glutamate/tyrosine decarboxylase-like PLP-dependent enzyme